jgi:hypothetical protein
MLMSAGDWVAAYAALVSTIALGWNIYRAYSDRGKLSVRCQRREGDTIPHEDRGARFTVSRADPVLRWTLTNIGTRPLTIRSVGAVLSESGRKAVSTNLDRILAPSAEMTVETFLAKTDARKVSALSAWDTRGREYRAPLEDLEAIRNLGT